MELISRQQAIDAVNSLTYPSSLMDVKRELIELPPAEQKRGKWVYQTGMIKCDQCLRAIRRIDHDGLLNFCPNCGADMRGEQND